MHITEYIKLATTILKDINYYSEISGVQLEKVISKYLHKVYDEQMNRICIELKMDEKQGKSWTDEQYKQKLEKMNNRIMAKIHKLVSNQRTL